MNRNGIKKLERKCPICQAEEGEILRNLEFALFDDCPMTDSFDVVACSDCSFVFYDTPDTAEQFSAFYRNHYFSSAYTSATEYIPESEAIFSPKNEPFSIVARHINSDALICEFGCGRGSLLLAFQKAGFSKLYGVEPSEQCVNFVKDTLNIAVKVGTVVDALFDVKFDLILTTHVFEHVVNLSEAASSVSSQLKDGGLAYIEVPNLAKYDVKKGMIPLEYLTFYEHINHFTLHSLQNLFARHGLNMIECGHKILDEETRLPLPAIYGLFVKGDTSEKLPPQEIEVDLEVVKRWLDEGTLDKDELAELAKAQTETYVWGINLFVQKLFTMSSLRHCNIAGLIDKDISKQHKTVKGMKVHSPDILKNAADDAVVVLWGGPYQKSIEHDLRKIGFQGRKIVL